MDLIGISIAPIEYYYGLKSFEHFVSQHGKWDVVIYDIRKYFSLLLKCNPNVLSLLWNEDDMHMRNTELGKKLILNRDLFLSKRLYTSFVGYAHDQLENITKSEFQGYMGVKRKALVKKYGYDVKNASHLIRLLETGIELLETGKLIVKRPNANYLINIKSGMYTLEQIKSKANSLLSRIRAARDTCKLPDDPDPKAADKLLIELIHSEMQTGRKRYVKY